MATLAEVQSHAQTLTDEELRDLRTWITITELPRREAEVAATQAETALIESLWEAHPEMRPDIVEDAKPAETLDGLIKSIPAWVQPETIFTGYPAAALVTHDGLVFRNRRSGNIKEPGTTFSGWENVTTDFLRPESIADGNDPDVGTDAPGLITPQEPEKPITPALGVKPYKDGENLSKGELRLYDGRVYVWQKTLLEKTKPETTPDKNTGHWKPLD